MLYEILRISPEATLSQKKGKRKFSRHCESEETHPMAFSQDLLKNRCRLK